MTYVGKDPKFKTEQHGEVKQSDDTNKFKCS